MPGLVVGHHALLVLGDHAARLHAGDHPLERRLEVPRDHDVAMVAAGEDRGLVADVGEVGTGQAAGLARDQSRSTFCASGLLRVWTSRIARPALEVGRRDEDLAVEAARAQQRRVELVEQVGGRDHDDLVARPKPSSSTSSWLSVWSFSPEMSLPRVAPTASSSSMKMIAGAPLRASRNRRLMRAAPRPRTSRRTRRPTARRTWPWTRWPPPWPAASCRCRAGRAAGCRAAPWRRAC